MYSTSGIVVALGILTVGKTKGKAVEAIRTSTRFNVVSVSSFILRLHMRYATFFNCSGFMVAIDIEVVTGRSPIEWYPNFFSTILVYRLRAGDVSKGKCTSSNVNTSLFLML